MTYFSTLNADTLERIARMSSHLPTEKWVSYVDQNTFGVLLDLSSFYEGLGRGLLKKTFIGDKTIIKEFRKAFFSDYLSHKSRKNELGFYARSIESLHIRSPNESSDAFMISTVASHGVMLKYLDSEIYMGDEALAAVFQILEKRGNQLKSLKIYNRANISNQVQFLQTVAHNCRNVTLLELQACANHIPPLFWERIGTTLLELRVTDNRFSVFDLASVQQHCRKLRKVHIEGDFREIEAKEPLKNLLLSYESQLERATVTELTAIQCTEIVTKCPNVKLDFEDHWRTTELDPLGKIRACGTNVFSYSVYFDCGNQFDDNQLREIIERCINLTKLQVCWNYQSEQRLIRASLSTRMKNLESLYIDGIESRYGFTSDRVKLLWKEITESVANNTRNLAYIKLRGLTVQHGTLKLVAESNQKLHNVQIRFSADSNLTAGAVDILESFSESTSLSHLSIDCESEGDLTRVNFDTLATACLPYRRRSLYVQVYDKIHL